VSLGFFFFVRVFLPLVFWRPSLRNFKLDNSGKKGERSIISPSSVESNPLASVPLSFPSCHYSHWVSLPFPFHEPFSCWLSRFQSFSPLLRRPKRLCAFILILFLSLFFRTPVSDSPPPYTECLELFNLLLLLLLFLIPTSISPFCFTVPFFPDAIIHRPLMPALPPFEDFSSNSHHSSPLSLNRSRQFDPCAWLSSCPVPSPHLSPFDV